MTPTPRALALVAVLALPVAAIVATLLLRGPADPPAETSVVRIGGDDGTGSDLPSVTPRGPGPDRPSPQPTSEPSPSTAVPTRDVVPPPPPVDDDDHGERDEQDDRDGGDDHDDD